MILRVINLAIASHRQSYSCPFPQKRRSGGEDKFMTPRAVLSLALFNGFRVLGTKSADPEDLKLVVETMAFKCGVQGIF